MHKPQLEKWIELPRLPPKSPSLIAFRVANPGAKAPAGAKGKPKENTRSKEQIVASCYY